LGCEDLVNDALHEAFLKIEGMGEVGAVKFPAAYLFRMILNVAEDQRKSKERLLSVAEIEGLYQVADELADPARIATGRADVRALEDVLAELPARRRAMLIAARIEELPHREIALRFGISQRAVEKELRAALEYCCTRLDRAYIQRFGPGASKVH
tara:strand:+ start:96 stop:560 length:465 start_codon:yes stop_codon:yes gene_type:complete